MLQKRERKLRSRDAQLCRFRTESQAPPARAEDAVSRAVDNSRQHCRLNICRYIVELTNTVYVNSNNISTKIVPAAARNFVFGQRNSPQIHLNHLVNQFQKFYKNDMQQRKNYAERGTMNYITKSANIF